MTLATAAANGSYATTSLHLSSIRAAGETASGDVLLVGVPLTVPLLTKTQCRRRVPFG
jgi:hypothetical protein